MVSSKRCGATTSVSQTSSEQGQGSLGHMHVGRMLSLAAQQIPVLLPGQVRTRTARTASIIDRLLACGYVIRPDGHVSHRASLLSANGLVEHFERVFTGRRQVGSGLAQVYCP
jgi:hypothetical protein